MTVGVRRELWEGLLTSSVLAQPRVSSLHATCVPDVHTPCRIYRTVSKVVCVALHVWIVAVPETVGVH